MSTDAGTAPRKGAARRARTKRPARRAPAATTVSPLEAPAPAVVSVLIAARPALFREILVRQLGNEPGFTIAGQVRDEEGVRSILIKDKPRVLLLDYEGLGPNADGLIPPVFGGRPRQPAFSSSRRARGTRRSSGSCGSGSSGLVAKQQGFAALVRAIRVVAAGELWANRRVTARAMERLADRSGGGTVGEPFSSREVEIAEAIGRGLRNKDIARRLQISEKTVKSHLSNIFRKLQVDNRFAVGLYVLDLPSKP